MKDALNSYLWLQERDLQARIQQLSVEQEIYGPKSTQELHTFWDKNNEYFQRWLQLKKEKFPMKNK